jgi:hypothetical protein
MIRTGLPTSRRDAPSAAAIARLILPTPYADEREEPRPQPVRLVGTGVVEEHAEHGDGHRAHRDAAEITGTTPSSTSAAQAGAVEAAECEQHLAAQRDGTRGLLGDVRAIHDDLALPLSLNDYSGSELLPFSRHAHLAGPSG